MKPHFLLIRSRSGRFNFTLITEHGRLTGVVTVDVPTGASQSILRERAMDKVRQLAADLMQTVDPHPGAQPVSMDDA